MAQGDAKSRIRRALLELMLEKSLDRITAKELAERAGIGRSTFYAHYESVYDALQEIEDDFFDGMKRSTELFRNAEFDDRYLYVPHALTISVLRLARENGLTLRALLGPHGEEQFKYKIDRLLQNDLATKAFEQGYLDVDPNERDAVSAFITNGHKALLLYVSEHPNDVDEKRMAVLAYRMLYGAFRPRGAE